MSQEPRRDPAGPESLPRREPVGPRGPAASARDRTAPDAVAPPGVAALRDGLEVPVSLAIFGATPTGAVATFVRQTYARRTVRAAVALVTCWTLALVSVVFPVAHFVLVPGFLVAGVVLAVVRAREGWRLTRVDGRCPRCGTEQVFPPGRRTRGQWVVQCPRCKNELALELQGSPLDWRPAT